MSKEIRFRDVACAAFVAALAFHTANTLIPNSTKRAWHFLTSPTPHCSEIMPPHHYYSVIAVFGAGTYTDGGGVERPNSFQTGRLKAASALFAAGYSDKIVLIDGGDEAVSNASYELINAYVREFSNGLKTFRKEDLEIIGDSVNTAENTDDLAAYLKRHRYYDALGVSDWFHYERLKLLTENYGVRSEIASTECVAAEYFPQDLPLFNERYTSPKMRAMIIKEKLALVDLMFDKKGRLSVSLKRLDGKK